MLECRNKRQMLEGQQQTIFNFLVGIFQKFATTNGTSCFDHKKYVKKIMVNVDIILLVKVPHTCYIVIRMSNSESACPKTPGTDFQNR